MKATLSSYIDLLTPYIPTDLISEAYLARIRAIGQELPVLSFGCFECWLAADKPRVDFNVSIAGKINEHKTITEWFAHRPEPDSDQQREALRRLQTICSTWSDTDYFLHPHLKLLWLVYDILDPIGTTPVPWMYLHFRKNRFSDDPVVRTEIILQTLTLMDDRYASGENNYVRSFFESVSPTVQICSIGVPTSRDSRLLRVYLMMQTYSDLVGILISHHWPGDLDDFQRTMHPLTVGCDFFGLSIDINPGLQPKVGIECWFNETHAQHKLSEFTNGLVENGLCSALKREALLTWNGSFETKTSLFWSWPDAMFPVENPESQHVTIRRMAQYVKFTYEPGEPLVAKGYLYFDRFLNRK